MYINILSTYGWDDLSTTVNDIWGKKVPWERRDRLTMTDMRNQKWRTKLNDNQLL